MNPLRRRTRSALFVLGFFLSGSSLLAVAQGRVTGTVIDENGQPLEGVRVTITSAEIDFEEVLSTDKKGRFKVLFLDATRPYAIRLEKAGFLGFEERLTPQAGGHLRTEWTLAHQGSAPAAAPQAGEARGGARDPAVIFNAGAAAARAGDTETAKAKFLEALEKDPGLMPAHLALAGVYVGEGKHAEALPHLERVMKAEPQNVRALSIAYECYRALGDDDRAKEVFKELSELQATADTAAVLYNEGVEAARVGDLDTAVARFEEALAINPELPNVYQGLAIANFNLGKYRQAADAAERWLELQPDAVQALRIRYDSYTALGETEKAGSAFDTLVAADPTAMAGQLFDEALAHFNEGRTGQARALAEKVIELQPNFPKAHYILGLCLISGGDVAEAKEHLRRFVELDPEDPDAPSAKEMIDAL